MLYERVSELFRTIVGIRFQLALLDEQYISNSTIDRNDVNQINTDPVILKIDTHCTQSNENQVFKRSCLFLFILLFLVIVVLAIGTTILFIYFIQLKEDFQIKEKILVRERTKNNRLLEQIDNLQLMTNETTENLFDRLEQSIDEQRKQNKTIEQLTNQLWQQQMKSNRMNDELNERVLELLDEQRQQNETIENLIHQCRARSSTKTKSLPTTTTGKNKKRILDFFELI